MGGRYLKVYRPTKWLQARAISLLAITDADMFEYDEDTESEIVTCIKNLPSRENCLFKWEFCSKVCLSKASLSRGMRNQNINSTLPLIVPAIVILVV